MQQTIERGSGVLENVRIPEPLIPKNLNELLSLKSTYPSSILLAGGTYLLRHYRYRTWPGTPYLIYIGDVKELNYISRTERFIELGAGASINRILQTGKNVLPKALNQALSGIGTIAVKNMATIGGNLCVSDRRMTLFPVLLQMDVKIELRKHGKSRWIPIQKFINNDGIPEIAEEEIVSRLRIPFNNWNNQVFISMGKGTLPANEELTFCGLCNTEKGMITDLRLAFGTSGTALFKNIEIESTFNGSTIPIPEKKYEIIDEILKDNNYMNTRFTIFQNKRIRKIIIRFLKSIQ